MESKSEAPVKTGAVNPDGSVFIGPGPMPPEFMATLRRQESGLAPAGASVPTTVNSTPETVPVAVARHALNRHMDVLKGKIADSDNMPDPYRFAGNGDPHMAEIVRQRKVMDQMAAAETERLKAELDSLEKLTDAGAVDWAVKNRRVGRHVSGGWVAV